MDATTFFEETPPQEGSWWPTWNQWLVSKSSGRTEPPSMGAPKDRYIPLANAPGTYVMQR